MLRCEAGEIVLDEDQADHVLEELHVGIGLQPLLAQQRPDARHDVVAVADLAQDGGGGVGVKAGEVRAPPAVALAAGRVVRTGDGPAPDVLAAGGEPHRLRGVGPEPVEAGGHAPGVDQLLRLLDPVGELAVRVFPVRGVEPLDGAAEPVV